MKHRKRDESGDQEQLICKRVEKRPQSRPLIELARDGTIDRIGKRSQQQREQRQPILAIRHESYVDRNEQDSKNRQTIWNVHGTGQGSKPQKIGKGKAS